MMDCTWYVSNRQIYEDLDVSLFADHIRALTASFDSKLSVVGNPLVRQFGRYLRWPRDDPVADAKSKCVRGQQVSRDHRPRWPIRQNELRSALFSRGPIGYPYWSFPWFSSVLRQMPWYSMQSRGTPNPPPGARWPNLGTWKKSHTPSLRHSQSGLRTLTSYQAKVYLP